MYTKQDLRKAKDLIEDSENIALIVHKNPDPDALGSAVALYHFLLDLGKSVYFFTPTIIPEWQSFIISNVDFTVMDNDEIPINNLDLLIYIDGGELNRFSKEGSFNPPSDIKTLKFDHHPVATSISEVSVYSKNVSSTAEIIYEFLTFWDFDINPEIAKVILIGIIGDTGWLKYNNTSSRTFEIVSDLIEINNCISSLDYNFNHNSQSIILPAWKILMANLIVDKENSFLYTYIDSEDFENLDMSDDTFSTAYHLFLDKVMRNFTDIDISALFLNEGNGKFHGSLRSEMGTVHVGKICGEFEVGGGHERAGGFTTKSNLKEILKKTYKGLNDYKLN